ncbi:MAG: indolepyruvate oxidoreductase subunit beta [Candidatus Bipolaricaulota bacterium]
MMKRDVVLAAVGGQGLLTISAVMAEAARLLGLHVRQSEVHGMAQRGGVVQGTVRFADRPIFSDLVRSGQADLILALEPMEALRYLPLLAPDGFLLTSSVPLRNLPDYPPIAEVLAAVREIPRHVVLDADAAARAVNAPRSANVVMLGAGAAVLGLAEDALAEALERAFQRKPGAADANLRAFRAGLTAAREALAREPEAS